MAQSVEHLLLAHVVTLGSWDQAPRQAPSSVGSLLLPLPNAPPACVLSRCRINKTFKINK